MTGSKKNKKYWNVKLKDKYKEIDYAYQTFELNRMSLIELHLFILKEC